jgi:hypothetical protein
MEHSNNDITWRGSKRTWDYIVTYKSISRTTGYADGTHAVVVYGNGYDSSRSDYRCKFMDGAGNVEYSAKVKPASSTELTCPTPIWHFAATSNPTTLYLMERSDNFVLWLGSARTFTYIITYKGISRYDGWASGGQEVTITGNGYDTSRSDYRCRFYTSNKWGVNQAYSANVKPTSSTSLTCITPIWYYTATSNPGTVYLMERSNNNVQWQGSKRNWVFIVVYASLSTHHGYADSTHSVTVYGNGFDTTRTDYRCRFRDGNGNQAYSATIGPASTTQMTCRSPYWYYASTDNSVTLYLMEQLNNDVQWLGSNRGWVYQVVYRYIEPRISSVRGGKVIKVSGYGMDVNRNDYVCIFRNQQGYERKSVAVKPNEGSYLQCTTPTFGSTLTLTSLILQENKKDVLWRGSDTWDRIINFARPLYIGYEKESKRNLAYYFNNVENKNVVLTPFG